MNLIFDRNERLLGPLVCEQLAKTKVLIVGLGGVGSFATESIARLGTGQIILVDHDVVDPTNCNRQLFALNSTIGLPKVEIAKQRILDINPAANVQIYQKFMSPDETEWLKELAPDFVVDAIDSLPSKWGLIRSCVNLGIPFISSTGMAYRLNPQKVSIQTLDKTSYDPVCKKLRLYARKEHIDLRKIRVIASKEQPNPPVIESEKIPGVRSPLASIVLVPATSGLLCGKALLEQVVNSLTKMI